MKYIGIILSTLFIFSVGYGQSKFERGRYLTTAGQEVSCLIKVKSLRSNSNSIVIKKSTNSEAQSIDIGQISKVEIFDQSKYIVATAVDGSEGNFLYQVLIDGDRSLLTYEFNKAIKYAILEGDDITPLIYTRIVDDNRMVRESHDYRKQLSLSLDCSTIDRELIKLTDYKRNDLIDFFIEYHSCANLPYTNHSANGPKGHTELHVATGLNSAKFIRNKVNLLAGERDLNQANSLIFGLSFQSYFSGNFNKWSFLGELLYQSYSGISESVSQDRNLTIQYDRISAPLGLRYDLYSADPFKISLTGVAVIDAINISSQFQFPLLGEQSPELNLTWGVGVGISFDDVSLEYRYLGPRNVLGNQTVRSTYNQQNILLRYRLFRFNS